jgi:MSHA biogenesis protein MshL
LLSLESGVTITADKDVEGKVTADVRDKTIREILTAIVNPLGYTFVSEEGTFRVGKPKMVSKTFFLNYIKDKRTSSSTMNAAISEYGNYPNGPAGSNINLNISPSTGSNATNSSSGSSSTQQGNVSVTTSGTSDFWSEAIRGLEVMIFGDAGGGQKTDGGFSRGDKTGKKLVINELAGVIYVVDYANNVANIKSFLDDVERSVQRQVLIQAHIVEVTLDGNYSFGLDWNAIVNYGSSKLSFAQALVPTPPSGVFQINLTSNKYNALLDAMKEQGQVNILSSPKVSTLNNQRAVIKLTTNEVSWITNTVFNAQGQLLQTSTNPQINEVGIFLDVTPQVAENGVITMQIHPSISEESSVSVSPDGHSNMPVIDIREVDTMVAVPSGKTIVIAGLIIDKITETKRSVPLLGDLPYVGTIFSNMSQVKSKVELVILLTPYVMNEKSIEEIRKEHEKQFSNTIKKFEEVP